MSNSADVARGMVSQAYLRGHRNRVLQQFDSRQHQENYHYLPASFHILECGCVVTVKMTNGLGMRYVLLGDRTHLGVVDNIEQKVQPAEHFTVKHLFLMLFFALIVFCAIMLIL